MLLLIFIRYVLIFLSRSHCSRARARARINVSCINQFPEFLKRSYIIAGGHNRRGKLPSVILQFPNTIVQV